MADGVLFPLTLVTALGCGLMAGFFFAFSACVMTSLARLPATQGIAAMQSINVVVINPLVMTIMFGTAVACLGLVAAALFGWDRPGAVYLLAGGLLYLIGTVLVTIVFHVPRNDALAAIDATSAAAATHWADYVPGWTAGNHVRTITSLAAAAALTMALIAR